MVKAIGAIKHCPMKKIYLKNQNKSSPIQINILADTTKHCMHPVYYKQKNCTCMGVAKQTSLCAF